ncbi:hypothetical protein [Shewanella sedimentimangrovi]|uniref:Uncharacterized protein n=1 Tax=Shewanella sedimentimangrovi TaxID=2814293 RepID=A0ABX7R196_9GAMM|nr:hypothetical protein [Shewanella sedimentimangrovi]QSX36621.1 hypothetical protein JYB85_15240 [Shewanella sedimentimangrovi]
MSMRYIAFFALLLGMKCWADEIGRDSEEHYLRLELAPICSAEGQVKLIFTNVSGGKLLVDPRYGDVEFFDAGNQAVYLSTADGHPLKLWPRKERRPTSDWTVFAAGQSVEHIIDFRRHNNELDLSGSYIASIAAHFNVIAEEGKAVRLTMYSSFLNKDLEIGPDCFK